MKLVISGSLPSQKNRKHIRYNRKTKKPFIASDNAVKVWQQAAMLELQQQFRGLKVVGYPISVDIVIYYDSDAKRDLDNGVNSIMDSLVKSGILVDDDYNHVSQICVQYGGTDKKNPRAEIYIDD